MEENEKRQWDVIYDNKPVTGVVVLLFLIASVVAIPIVVAAVFNVSIWVPIVTMLLGWVANIISALWRNYLVMKIMLKR